jgi:hypothetical protein
MSEDQKVSQAYRELGAEEPPRHVDEVILAASRRAVSARPAPLVAPTGRRRWYFPVAAAAVIVLAAGVALHVERDLPDPEVAVLMKRQVEQAPARQETEMRAPAAAAPAMEAPKEKKLTEAPARREQEMRPPAASAPAPAPAPARAPQAGAKAFAYTPEAKQEQQAQDRVVVEAQRADEAARDRRASSSAALPSLELGAAAGAVGLRGLADQPPEKWIETITELRKAGQHDEADKLLEEFRKRFPDYKVPEAALRK